MSGYTLIHTHKHINKHTRSHRSPHESVQTQVFLFTKNSYTRYISSQIHACHAPYIPRKEHKIQASGEGSININKSPKGIPWKNKSPKRGKVYYKGKWQCKMLIMDKCVTDEYVGFDSPTYMSQSCKIISMKNTLRYPDPRPWHLPQ